MQVVPVDVHDRAAFAAWAAVFEASSRHDRPTDPVEPLEAQVALSQRRADGADLDEAEVLRAVVVDGETVGALRLELPLQDNTHLVWATLAVLPTARRRGAGTALLEAALAQAGAHGRSTVVGEVDEPQPGSSPGRAFAEHHGFTLDLDEVRRDLALPVAAEHLAELEAQALQHAAGYRLRSWVGPTPQDLLDGRALMGRRMSTDAPKGELDYEEKEWDADRVRRHDALAQAQGRTVFGTAAIHAASGDLVGFTEIGVPAGDRTVAHQWETLVLDEHRGHRLGLLLKVANLRQLQSAVPEATTVTTCNAPVNAPMLAVNELLGFVVNGHLGAWQRKLLGAAASRTG